MTRSTSCCRRSRRNPEDPFCTLSSFTEVSKMQEYCENRSRVECARQVLLCLKPWCSVFDLVMKCRRHSGPWKLFGVVVPMNATSRFYEEGMNVSVSESADIACIIRTNIKVGGCFSPYANSLIQSRRPSHAWTRLDLLYFKIQIYWLIRTIGESRIVKHHQLCDLADEPHTFKNYFSYRKQERKWELVKICKPV